MKLVMGAGVELLLDHLDQALHHVSSLLDSNPLNMLLDDLLLSCTCGVIGRAGT